MTPSKLNTPFWTKKKLLTGQMRVLPSTVAALNLARSYFPLGKPSFQKSAVFFNIVQKAFDPPPLLFEHYVVNFSEGILTKVRKRLSQQLSTK